MKWLFSPGIPSPPPPTSVDVSNEKVLKSPIKPANKRKVNRLTYVLPIAFLVLVCLGLSAHNVDFKFLKDDGKSESSVRKLKNLDPILEDTPYEDTKPSEAFMPLMYELDLKFRLKKQESLRQFEKYAWEDTFDGKVKIHLLCLEKSSKIELNAKDLSIDTKSIQVVSREGPMDSCSKPNTALKFNLVENSKLNKLIFTFDSFFLPSQHIIITLDYSGTVFSDAVLFGIYKTYFKGSDGKRRSTLATELEPQAARTVVPCFDVPDKRASWKLKITHPSEFTALSNTPVEKITDLSEGMKTTEFKETPRMSSYLVAIALGQFSYIHTTNHKGVKIGVYANAPASEETMKHALSSAIESLELMEKYTNINYLLDKLDLVGLTDFAAGAMENWGLMTFKQQLVVFDPRYSAEIEKVKNAQVIQHEIAHQWFGNLVTLKDWQYTWLNEGLTSFFEIVFSKNFINLIEGFMGNAMYFDALSTSYPISYKLDSAEEIKYNLGVISYYKGACVMWMVQQLITPEAFKLAIQDYLKSNKYENAVPQDLFDSFKRYVPDDVLGPDGKKFDVELFMRQYSEQTGYPVVIVTRLNTRQLKLSQKRYRSNPNFKDIEKYANPEFGHKWDVPIFYNQKQQVKFAWLKRNEDLIIESDSPIVLNVKGRMYYKVFYAEQQIKKSVTVLKDFPTEAVECYIKDVFDPSLLHMYTPEILMEFSKTLVDQGSPHAEVAMEEWTNILQSYGSLEVRKLARNVEKVLSSPYSLKQNKHFSSQNYASVVMKKFHKASKSHSVEKFNKAFQEVKECGDACFKMVSEQITGNFTCTHPTERTSECSTINAEYRAQIYCGVVQRYTNGYNMLLLYYKNEIVDKEKENILRGLMCSNGSSHMKYWLDRSIYLHNFVDARVRVQDFPTLYSLVAENPVGKTVLLDHFITNWKKLYENIKHNQSILKQVVRVVAGVINTQEDWKKFAKFINENPEASKMMIFRESLERAHTNVNQNNQHVKKLEGLFS